MKIYYEVEFLEATLDHVIGLIAIPTNEILKTYEVVPTETDSNTHKDLAPFFLIDRDGNEYSNIENDSYIGSINLGKYHVEGKWTEDHNFRVTVYMN